MSRNMAAATTGHQRRAYAPASVHYFAIDGGAGAHLLEQLPRHDPSLSRVLSPWQADLLIVVGPLTARIASAIREVAQTLPDPARVLVVRVPSDGTEENDLTDTLLPGARQVTASTSGAVVAAIREAGSWSPVSFPESQPLPELPTIPLPQPGGLEMATELEVLSLGPLQPFTAGPARFWLVCDGDQVHQCRIEAGYAGRNIAERMKRANWQEAARFATALDPLAPLTGRLAYVRAVEHLQRRTIPEAEEHLREAALALERAQNALWWAARFFRLMALSPGVDAAGTLATALDRIVAGLWAAPPADTLVPGLAPQPRIDAQMAHRTDQIRTVAGQASKRIRTVASNRLFTLRTRGVGRLTSYELVAAGVTGPALFASERWGGDMAARLIAHLDLARVDLERVTQVLEEQRGSSQSTAVPEPVRVPESSPRNWLVPDSGEATGTADGPRGRITVQLRSSGGTGPAEVRWERPSAGLLGLVPQLLTGRTVSDAGLLVANLDLSMAEADG